MNDDRIREIGEKVMSGEIDIEEAVDLYNAEIEKEKPFEEFHRHENI